jgi:hypothetical protein
MRVMILEYPPYINTCAVQYRTITPTSDCMKPGRIIRLKLTSLKKILAQTFHYLLSNHHILDVANKKVSPFTGVYAEFAYAVLFLAKINYTIIPVFLHGTENGTVSLGGFDNNTGWFSGEMGKMGTLYDMIITSWTLPNVERQKRLLFFEPGESIKTSFAAFHNTKIDK